MITFNAQYARRQISEEGYPELVFTVKGAVSQTGIQELQKDTAYRFQLNEIKSKRSLEQNAMLWKLIDEIACVTGNDEEDIYLLALEKAGAKYEYIACLPEAEESLKKAFRVVKLMNQFVHNGRTFNQYKAFIGSSKMNTKEMSNLLDTVIQIAGENGIYLEEYEWKI